MDPPDGRIPPLTPEAQQRRTGYREFQLALLQETDSCKNKGTSCPEGEVWAKLAEAGPSPLPRTHRSAQSRGRSRGPQPDRTLHGRHAARYERIPPDRAVSRDRVGLIRRRPGPKLAADHPGQRRSSPASLDPRLVRGFARAAGRGRRSSLTSRISARRQTSEDPTRTCISSSAGRALTRTRSNIPSRSRIRRRGRDPGPSPTR